MPVSERNLCDAEKHRLKTQLNTRAIQLLRHGGIVLFLRTSLRDWHKITSHLQAVHLPARTIKTQRLYRALPLRNGGSRKQLS